MPGIFRVQWGCAMPGVLHVPIPRTRCSPPGSHPGRCPHPKFPIPILTSLSLSPALGPVPQVRGCHDQVQRGAGGFPGAEQGPDPAAAGNQCVTEPPVWGGRGLGIKPHLFHKLGGVNSYRPHLTTFGQVGGARPYRSHPLAWNGQGLFPPLPRACSRQEHHGRGAGGDAGEWEPLHLHLGGEP